MDPILKLSEKYDLFIVEDAAQAHGAEYKGRSVGSMGDAAAFSFYPGKNLGAYGEAGAVVTDNSEIAKKVKMLRNHAQPEKYLHETIGYNYRMGALQAAVLKVKLPGLDDWNQARKMVALSYDEKLEGLPGVKTPYRRPDSSHVYHLYQIQLDSFKKREELRIQLAANGIETGLHYPVPVHLQKAYCELGYKEGDFPESEKASQCNLSLPIYPGMSDDMISVVCGEIEKWSKMR
jgi:dTDP-4-amino-4,6-dideoxygalactose transaminase